MNSRRPILITGAPRSGTTWVGRMLAEDPGVRYIHEPFNIAAPQCRCGVNLDYWFYYATSGDLALHRHLKHLLASPVHPTNILNAIDAVLSNQRRNEGLRGLKSIAISLRTRRPLIKDPLAIFSAEWLVTQFDMDVFVLIRHPAAFVASYKKLGWTHPFWHFLQQPALLQDCLPLFTSEIEAFVNERRDLIEQAALLWRLIHFQIHRYQLAHPDWIFIRYMDLARDPLTGFTDIFRRAGLPFTKSIQAKIVKYATASDQRELDNPYSIQRDSRSSIERWKQQLTASEVDRIRIQVADVSSFFYTDDEW